MNSYQSRTHRLPLAAIGFSVVLAFALLYVAVGSVAVDAHEDDDMTSYEHHRGWVFACEDRVNGCTEGGLLYHTEQGPDAGVYFIAHYPQTGNVYARKVQFED